MHIHKHTKTMKNQVRLAFLSCRPPISKGHNFSRFNLKTRDPKGAILLSLEKAKQQNSKERKWERGEEMKRQKDRSVGLAERERERILTT